MATTVDSDGTARGILAELDDEHVVLTIPGTDYRLQLVPTVPASGFSTPVGKRVRGIIEAEALRMHPAEGGGRFIEPVYGAPRILAGTVLAVQEGRQRVLLDVAVPMWVSWDPGQDLDVLQVGRLVNCYVKSGTTFTPA
ncbi:MAG: hypothetical protein ACYTGC_18490 [Planctomycetota bacterium]